MEEQFDKLARLRANTYNYEDKGKILDAMLRIGTYDQLARLRANTYNYEDKGKILDAMLAKTDKKAKSTQVTRRPLTKHSYKKQYDVFIAHASEDKGFATPLAQSLKQKEVEVWYDDFVLKLGDSLQHEIDRGLAQSRYGVLILSHNFFNKLWPQKEHDGLATKEQLGKKVILPIWHNIDKEGVAFYSPTLAGRYAAKSSLGVEAVAKKIIDVISAK